MMKNLLIVDDDIAILKQLSFALGEHYNVLEATTVEETLELLSLHKDAIDIALVDLGLPPFENSHRQGRIVVSALLSKTDAKVIVLTGQENPQYPKELIQMGVFDYLFKPVEIPSLLNSLQRAVFFLENEETKESSHEVNLSFKAPLQEGLKGSADEAQKQLLLKILHQTDFNINKTAKILGISRENCYYFLKKFQIERPNV